MYVEKTNISVKSTISFSFFFFNICIVFHFLRWKEKRNYYYYSNLSQVDNRFTRKVNNFYKFIRFKFIYSRNYIVKHYFPIVGEFIKYNTFLIIRLHVTNTWNPVNKSTLPSKETYTKSLSVNLFTLEFRLCKSWSNSLCPRISTRSNIPSSR